MTDRAIKMSDLDKLRERMDQIFKDLVRQNHPMLMKGEKSWVPAVDIYETSEGLFIAVDLPGVKKDDVDIEIKDNFLTLRGQGTPALNFPKTSICAGNGAQGRFTARSTYSSPCARMRFAPLSRTASSKFSFPSPNRKRHARSKCPSTDPSISAPPHTTPVRAEVSPPARQGRLPKG